MTGQRRLLPTPGLHEEQLDGDIVLLDVDTGVLHVLTGTAAMVWGGLRAGQPVAAVVRDVTAAFGAAADAVAEREVVDFVTDLHDRGLLVERGR